MYVCRRLGGASPACPTPRTGKSQFAFAFRFSLSLRSCVRACERSCASAGEMLPLRLVVLEFERSASSPPPFAVFLCFCCVLRGFYGLFVALVFVCAVFYVGFKRFFLLKSLFCYVFVVFYVGFMAFASVPRAAQSSPEQPRSSPEQPRAVQSSPEQPRAAQSSPEQP